MSERLDNLARCLETVASAVGKPLIYTNRDTWAQYFGNSDRFGDYALWVADYPQSPGEPRHVPSGWSRWTVHQYASIDSDIPGIESKVDKDCLSADTLDPILRRSARAAQLAALAGRDRPKSPFAPSMIFGPEPDFGRLRLHGSK